MVSDHETLPSRTHNLGMNSRAGKYEFLIISNLRVLNFLNKYIFVNEIYFNSLKCDKYKFEAKPRHLKFGNYISEFYFTVKHVIWAFDTPKLVVLCSFSRGIDCCAQLSSISEAK